MAIALQNEKKKKIQEQDLTGLPVSVKHALYQLSLCAIYLCDVGADQQVLRSQRNLFLILKQISLPKVHVKHVSFPQS